MRGIIIVGAGGHARVVADVVRLSEQYELYGFLDQTDAARRGEAYEGVRVLGGEEQLPELLKKGVRHAVIAIGDNRTRARVGQQLRDAGFTLATLVHPRAIVAASVQLGAGTVIFAGAVINAATMIGEHVIINTAASVDHDSVLGDGVHIAPGVHMGGHVTVGRRALIGLGASVKPAVRIGADAVVGVGAVVISDVADGQTVVGVPARPT